MLEIENELFLKLANFESPPVGLASPQFAAQNLRLAAAVVTLSSTSALTEATAPSKTTSAPIAADRGTVQGDGVDEDYMPNSKKMHTGFQQSPAAGGYTSQPVICDGLSNYLGIEVKEV